jgi:hypothetical protein
MRKAGHSYRQILETLPLPVAKSSLSLWLRDIPLSDDQKTALKARQVQAKSRRAQSVRAQRVRRQETVMNAARAQVQALAESELFVAGLAAYWAEGTKAKPWRASSERVVFINSDPTMIRLFLAWLDLIGVGRERLIYRLSIHETAGIAESTRFWADVVGASESDFRRPTIKRHQPKTNRRNTGSDYHGCLVINVRRSTELYRQIAGWWAGVSDCLSSRPVPFDGNPEWCNGSTSDFGSASEGSSPSSGASPTTAP